MLLSSISQYTATKYQNDQNDSPTDIPKLEYLLIDQKTSNSGKKP